jgi:flagellar hook-associated protein 1 FlgK
MSLGVKAMAANYAALQTTGNNIANANVVGYSRQQAQLVTSEGQFTGAGFFGRGVDVATVTRAHDDFLSSEAVSAKSLSAMDAARYDQLQGLENVFKTGEQGLGNATSLLFNAMSDVASNPGDLSARQVALARASDLAAQFSQASSALDAVQTGVSSQLSSAVAGVNSLTQGIAGLNTRIAAMQGSGQTPNDLLDQRDRLISQLSEQVQVTRIDSTDGTTAVFVAGGQSLVLGSEASSFQLTQDPADPTHSALSLVNGGVTRPLDPNALGGGAMTGLLRFQNSDLSQARDLIGQLAAAVAGAANARQALGISLQSPLGQVAGSPLFALGPAQALPNAANARDAAGRPIGSVQLTLTDPAALQASDYALRDNPSAPGSWQLTRLSDGKVSTVASGDVVDGMRIDIATPQAGDRFLLQPVARAAAGMASLLADPRDIAAASPLVASTPTTNAGTAAVTGLTSTALPLPFPATSETITFSRQIPAVNGYDYMYTPSLGAGPVPWNAGQPVLGSNGYTLQLSGVPQDGDKVTVAPTPAAQIASNNGNANAFVALRDAALVGGHSATDAWAQSLAEVGVRVQSAKTASDISGAASSQAEQARSSQAGVNLDEEAARLIQFQQSYQAAAKVLQVAQALFDTLLQTAGA